MVRSGYRPARGVPDHPPGCQPVSQATRDTADLTAELERLRTVTSLMTGAVTQCSSDFRYRWVSPAYGLWIGRPPDEIIGRRI